MLIWGGLEKFYARLPLIEVPEVVLVSKCLDGLHDVQSLVQFAKTVVLQGKRFHPLVILAVRQP